VRQLVEAGFSAGPNGEDEFVAVSLDLMARLAAVLAESRWVEVFLPTRGPIDESPIPRVGLPIAKGPESFWRTRHQVPHARGPELQLAYRTQHGGVLDGAVGLPRLLEGHDAQGATGGAMARVPARFVGR
jgi:hypothetical protein